MFAFLGPSDEVVTSAGRLDRSAHHVSPSKGKQNVNACRRHRNVEEYTRQNWPYFAQVLLLTGRLTSQQQAHAFQG